MSEKIKWGVLGYARIARLFTIPAILKSSNSEFYAIASRNQDKLDECREKFNCKKTYSRYEDLLNDPEIQAVYIPLPNSLHKEWVIKAAKKGKHILCEKPIALSADEAQKMKDICDQYNVKLMEAFMYRYTDRIKKLQQLLKTDPIGDIKYINSSFRFFLNRENTIKVQLELGGGSIYDTGCYPLNFVGMILNQEPISVSAQYTYENGVDTMFTGILKYSNDTIAVINSGFNAFDRNYSEIIGTKGIIQVPDTFLGTSGFITVITKDGERQIPVEESDRYLLEIEDFADAIINDKKPTISMEDSIRDMKIMDQLLALR